MLLQGLTQPNCIALAGGGSFLTVKVGFSMAEVVLVSSTDGDEDSRASSVSSALTWPRRAAEE